MNDWKPRMDKTVRHLAGQLAVIRTGTISLGFIGTGGWTATATPSRSSVSGSSNSKVTAFSSRPSTRRMSPPS